MDYSKLFNYLNEQHGITLLESEMQEIVNIVNEMHEKEIGCTHHWDSIELIVKASGGVYATCFKCNKKLN